MDIVFREAAKKAGKTIDEQQATMRKEMFRQVVEDQSSAYYTSSRIIDDGIIGLSPLACVIASSIVFWWCYCFS
jgi:acetyl-CoA carboxylase carboxyltransferase component